MGAMVAAVEVVGECLCADAGDHDDDDGDDC